MERGHLTEGGPWSASKPNSSRGDAFYRPAPPHSPVSTTYGQHSCEGFKRHLDTLKQHATTTWMRPREARFHMPFLALQPPHPSQKRPGEEEILSCWSDDGNSVEENVGDTAANNKIQYEETAASSQWRTLRSRARQSYGGKRLTGTKPSSYTGRNGNPRTHDFRARRRRAGWGILGGRSTANCSCPPRRAPRQRLRKGVVASKSVYLVSRLVPRQPLGATAIHVLTKARKMEMLQLCEVFQEYQVVHHPSH